MTEICEYFVPRGTKLFRGGPIFLWGGTKRGGTKFSGEDLFLEGWGGTKKKSYGSSYVGILMNKMLESMD